MTTSTATAEFLQPLGRERALLWCLLASIALHALVLFSMSRYQAPAPQSRTLAALTARLAPMAAAARPPVQAAQPKRAPLLAPRPAPAKPVAAPAPAAQMSVPTEPETAAPAEPAPAPPSSAVAAAQPAAQALDRSLLPPAAASAPGTMAAPKSSNEADAGTLEQYRLALIVAARRHKRYPAIAIEKGWQGRTDVHMVIGANGMIASAAIKTSSGHEILDNQALDMLKQGKGAVPIPANLRGREFSLDVPVIFNLDHPNS